MSGENNNEPICNSCLFVTINYLLHIIVHIVAINYVILYILFLDAEENKSFMISEAKSWKAYKIMDAFIIVYIIMFIQGFWLTVKYTRHILPIIITTAFYGIGYIAMIIGVIKNQGCKERSLLTCYGEQKNTYTTNETLTYNNSYNNETITSYNVTTQTLTNESLTTSETYLQFTLLILFIIIIAYTMFISILENRLKTVSIYYYSKNVICEFIYLILNYFLYGLLIVFVPFLCFANTTSNTNLSNQIAIGNFVNGNQIQPDICHVQTV